MFGFKIIRKSEYRNLLAINKALRCYLDREIKLRQQTPVLSNYVVLKESDYPCDRCKSGYRDCKKLSFADRTVCVIEKNKLSKK